MMRYWWDDDAETGAKLAVGTRRKASVGDQGVFSGLLWYQPITLRWHSNGTRQSFWGGIVLESKYKRKIFSLYQNIFWYPSSTRRCLNHLVTVLGQIWNDLQLLIGVFREAGGRSLPLNNNSSLIPDHNFGLSDRALDDLGNSQCDIDRWNSCLVQYLGNRIQGSEDDDKRHSRTFYRSYCSEPVKLNKKIASA